MPKTKTKKCKPHPKAGSVEIKTSLGVMIVLLVFIGFLGMLMSAL